MPEKQNRHYYKPKQALSQRKTGTLATQKCLFCIVISNLLIINLLQIISKHIFLKATKADIHGPTSA